MKTSLILLLATITLSAVSQDKNISGIYIEYKRTLWNGDDGSDYTYDSKPFPVYLQFEFSRDSLTIHDKNNIKKGTYSVSADTLTFKRELGTEVFLTKYIIIDSNNGLILKEYNILLDENFYLKTYYLKNSNLSNKFENVYPKVNWTIDQMPTYADGGDALKKTIIKEGGKSRIKGKGKVFIQLLISPEGRIESVEIQNNAGNDFAKEAVKIIRKLSTFNPGKQSGKAVYSYLYIPINFENE